jgi:hypothetical protein
VARIKGLNQVSERPHHGGLAHRLLVIQGGEEYEWYGELIPQQLGQGQTRGARHLDVEHRQIRRRGCDSSQCFSDALRGHDLIASLTQGIDQQIAELPIIVHYEKTALTAGLSPNRRHFRSCVHDTTVRRIAKSAKQVTGSWEGF